MTQSTLPKRQLQRKGFISLYFIGFCHRKEKAERYKRLMKKSKERVNRDLDIRSFLQSRLEFQNFISILLSQHQLQLLRRLSNLRLNESAGPSDLDTSLKYNKFFYKELEQYEKAKILQNLEQSSDPIDQRLHNILRTSDERHRKQSMHITVSKGGGDVILRHTASSAIQMHSIDTITNDSQSDFIGGRISRGDKLPPIKEILAPNLDIK